MVLPNWRLVVGSEAIAEDAVDDHFQFVNDGLKLRDVGP